MALDEATRADLQGKIDALDRREADAIAEQRNRDQATLVALQNQLHDKERAEIDKTVAEMRAKTTAKLRQEGAGAQVADTARVGALTHGAASDTVAVPADLRAKIDALHKQYQAQFTHDADDTVAAFKQTREDIGKRFAALRGETDDARESAAKQIADLQKERTDLYEQMVAQIDREVKTVAVQRGVGVVLRDVAGPAQGVDLTADVRKEIENLHE
jgi:hypothetical protein